MSRELAPALRTCRWPQCEKTFPKRTSRAYCDDHRRNHGPANDTRFERVARALDHRARHVGHRFHVRDIRRHVADLTGRAIEQVIAQFVLSGYVQIENPNAPYPRRYRVLTDLSPLFAGIAPGLPDRSAEAMLDPPASASGPTRSKTSASSETPSG